MSQLFQDVRYAFRMMRAAPGFALTAILTLALGIGANTAIFSVVDAVLLRPLPYREPGQLVRITATQSSTGSRELNFSQPELEDLQLRSGLFSDVSVAWPVDANLTGGEHPERIQLLGISPNYFTMLGATPELGRVFGPGDRALGFAEGVVISDGLWRRMFGADPGILGRKLRLDGDLYTVIGVLKPDFRHPGRTLNNKEIDAWASAGYAAPPFPKPGHRVRFLPGLIGRLKDGITPEQAESRLSAFSAEIRREFPGDYPAGGNWTAAVQPLQASLTGNVRPMLLAVMGAVALIILLASVNVANLLLARAMSRQREMAVRLALGAAKARLFRQMLTESIVLAMIAAIAGVLTAAATLQLLVHEIPSRVPRLNEVSLDWRVLVFALGLSLLTGILFGLAPAVQVAKNDLLSGIREGATGSGYSRKTSRLRGYLIVSEVALAVVLMVGGGLLLRTFWKLLQVDPGFNPSYMVTANLWIPVPNDPSKDPYAKPEAQSAFVNEVMRRVRGIPGVQKAALSSSLPTSGAGFRAPFVVEGRPQESAQGLIGESISVSPDYFAVLQADLLEGRTFTDGDQANKEQVLVIDESTARKFWSGQDPLGRRVRFAGQLPDGSVPPWMRVVGVIGDIKHDGLDADSSPHIYTSVYQFFSKSLAVAVRTNVSPAEMENELRGEIQAVDPNLPVFNVRSMNDMLDASLESRRFSAELVAIFALLALSLSSIGIYGLLAYLVNQRTQEIGIRIALGAKTSDIRNLVLAQGGRLAAAGAALGLALALVTARGISSLLWGVQPWDPVVLVSVPVTLLAVALLASCIPAWRAAAVDPSQALRYQ